MILTGRLLARGGHVLLNIWLAGGRMSGEAMLIARPLIWPWSEANHLPSFVRLDAGNCRPHRCSALHSEVSYAITSGFEDRAV